jgi:hypothetical protein
VRCRPSRQKVRQRHQAALGRTEDAADNPSISGSIGEAGGACPAQSFVFDIAQDRAAGLGDHAFSDEMLAIDVANAVEGSLLVGINGELTIRELIDNRQVKCELQNADNALIQLGKIMFNPGCEHVLRDYDTSVPDH